MIGFVVFDAATGEITRTGACPEDMVEAQAQAGEASFAASADMLTDYVDVSGPTVTPRPALPAMVEGPTGTWTATGCPDGMVVAVWDREIGALIDTVSAVAGAVSITLPDPGPYRLDSAVWPYLPRSIEVDVG